MIKVTAADDCTKLDCAMGTLPTIINDTLNIVKSVCRAVRENNPEHGEKYKQAVLKHIGNSFEENELIQELKDLKKAEME